MKKLYIISLLLLSILLSFTNTDKDAEKLETIIIQFQDHEGYDREEFPLGLVSKAFYKQEADFAASLLEKLEQIDKNALNETQQISFELLKFKLQDEIDYFEFERYLNPLLSDSGCPIPGGIHG